MAEYGLSHSVTAVIRRGARLEKLITLLLLFTLLTAATAGVSSVLTGPDWAALWESLLLGLLAGWVLAILRWKAWTSALLLVVLGLLFSFLFAGGLSGKFLAVFGELFRLVGQVISSLSIKAADLTPLNSVAGQALSSTGVVVGRVYIWVKDLLTAQPAFDPVAAGIVWSIVVWLVAAWAGWMVEAGRNALAAVLPALLLNLSILSYGRNNSVSIYLMLGLTLVLISVVQYEQREHEWNESGVAYPSRKSREVGNISLAMAIILVVMAAAISSLSIQRIIHWTSELRGSSAPPESGLAKSLGIQAAATNTPDAFTNLRTPGLPRELLIGSGPELSTEQVMSVEVEDLTALASGGRLPPLYWRSFTYDIYSGHGWSSSTTQQSQYQPEQPIQADQLPDHLSVQEVVRPVPGQEGTIYAAGEPVRVNVASRAAWRTANDLFGIQTGNSAYEVRSLVPVIDEASLRKAGEAYPSWVVKRYLAIPPEVPTRVKELAIQLTATEPTPYDRARAIEQHLRQNYPYTLDVPRPPANQDLV
ncbi:MAG TPA: transglutaminaseTgpA domain-containing protein, partial [Anaerolineales bacterium]